MPRSAGTHRLLASSCAPQVFYNNKGYHSMPTYLNSLNNAILRANLPKNKGHPAAYGELGRNSCGWVVWSRYLRLSFIVPQASLSPTTP